MLVSKEKKFIIFVIYIFLIDIFYILLKIQDIFLDFHKNILVTERFVPFRQKPLYMYNVIYASPLCLVHDRTSSLIFEQFFCNPIFYLFFLTCSLKSVYCIWFIYICMYAQLKEYIKLDVRNSDELLYNLCPLSTLKKRNKIPVFELF